MGKGALAALWGIQFKMADTAGALKLSPSLGPSEVTSKKYKGSTFIKVLLTRWKDISKSRFWWISRKW